MEIVNTNTFAPSAQARDTRAFPVVDKKSKVVVVGAGAFGGWTALYLLRAGYRVTLCDAWGAGNARSSSGDETRVIRSAYGANETYFALNVRALELWKENQERFNRKLFHPSGVLWLCHDASAPLVDDSIPFAEKYNNNYEYLAVEDLRKRFPLLRSDDLHHGWFDPFGGHLKAREATIAVKDAFVREGGHYQFAHVTPGPIRNGRMESVLLQEHGNPIEADMFIFACGAWLGRLFPDILGQVITCTRQEVYYFGVPATLHALAEGMPAWIDLDGKDFYYGICSNDGRGFKIGVDKRGVTFDPTAGERILDKTVLKGARQFIFNRFPELANAPLLENRVCPYENSPDGNFLLDLHPEASNVIFQGGGSGHGFKHGPAFGELVSKIFKGEATCPSIFCRLS